MEFITLLAIFLGPITAVFVTRWVDHRRERHSRRMEVFRTLMRTRRTPVFPDHVGALNLIEIEFSKDKEVLAAWKALFSHFGTTHPLRPDEQTADGMSRDEINARRRAFDGRLLEERQRLLAKLLHAMAKVLDFRIEQLEIFEGGYTPQGWVDVDAEQREVRRYLIDLGTGRRLVPVAILATRNAEEKEDDQAR